MVTTAEKILERASRELGEPTVDLSATRITYFNEAYQYYLSLHKWSFKIKKGTLTTDGSPEYDLTTLFPDYSTTDGIYMIKNGDVILTPIDFADAGVYKTYGGKQCYYLTPDGKSLGLIGVSSGTTLDVYYYAVLREITDATEALNIPIPEAHIRPIVTYLKHIVYDRKRQRNDARNMILDFQEQLEEMVTKDADNKTSKLPSIFEPVTKRLGLNRNYS